MTEARCPLCRSAAAGPAFPYATQWGGKRFEYLQCERCSTACLHPLPDTADLERLYAKETYHDAHGHELDFARAAGSVSRGGGFMRSGASLLDFGCGGGAFLKAAGQVGMKAVGIEYDAGARNESRAHSGTEVLTLDEVLASGASFDIIHMADVLEHLPEPGKVLAGLEPLLNDGGVFFIEGPLERNPSPVFWTAAAFKRLRRGLGLDRPGVFAPHHVFLTDSRAQLYFFTEVMRYRLRAYEVFETGHPYVTSWDILRRTIGRSAVALSALVPTDPRFFGNRFSGIFEPARKS